MRADLSTIIPLSGIDQLVTDGGLGARAKEQLAQRVGELVIALTSA